MKMAMRLLAAAALAAMSACSSIAPDKPVRSTQYDFGPGPTSLAPSAATLPAIVLADVEGATSLESMALLYRLGYADAHQLHPYAQARWAAPPTRLVRQRLRELLGRDRPVLDPSESAALARTSGVQPRVLRVDLEEFSHVFESPTQSFGIVRLRATLTENTPAGEKLVGQREFMQRNAAPSADASGGVRAIAASTDAVARDIAAWLAQQR